MKRHSGRKARAQNVEFRGDSGVGPIFEPHNVSLPVHDALGEEKAGGEFEIIPRRAHCDGERGRGSIILLSRLDPNFHRLLGGDDVGFLHGEIASNLPNPGSTRWDPSVPAFPFAAAAGAIRTSAL